MRFGHGLLLVAFVASIAMLTVASVAVAARPASAAERQQLFRASAKARYVRAHVPARCVRIRMVLSDNGEYAFVGASFTASPDCERFGFNGYELFRRIGSAWMRIFVGSDPPPCSYAVPHDLVACLETPPPGPNNRIARAELVGRGYQVRGESWDEEQQFNALVVGHRRGGGSRERVFFFSRSTLVGADSPVGSGHVALAWRGDDVIALAYGLTGRGCPAARTVRFVLRDGRLARLDPLPPSDPRVRCHR